MTRSAIDLSRPTRRAATEAPLYLAGFSLGGNVALKLAGELQDEAKHLLAGVCAVSTPIDLAACVHAIEQPRNRLYQNRFLVRLKDRIRRSTKRPTCSAGFNFARFIANWWTAGK